MTSPRRLDRFAAGLALLLGLTLGLLLMLASPPARAQDVQAVPVLTGHLIDQAALLDTRQRGAIEARLTALETELGTQMVVLIVSTTQPEDIAAYAQRVADSWKIGRREVGDGLLLVIASADRRMRIEVAKTLEGAIPDLAAKQVIDSALTPAFKRGDFAGGIGLAIEQLRARVKGEALPAPAAPGGNDSSGGIGGVDWESLAMLAFVGVPIIARTLSSLFGRKLGPLLTAGGVGAMAWMMSASVVLAVVAGLLGMLVALLAGAIGALPSARGGRRGWGGPGGGLGGLGGGGWGGGSGGSGGGGGGGGGFSSGGGGDFGGGGASGGW